MSETDTSGLMPSAAAYEEAKWSRVLAQQAVAFSAFAAVLVLTRLWTSFTSTKFLRRRHKNQVDTFLALTDIVCSTASMFIFVAQSIIREYQVGITAVEVLLSSFYAVAFVRRLWVKNFDFAIAFTFSTFFDVYAVSVISYQVFSPEPTWLTPTFMRSISVLIRYEEVMKMGFWASYAGEVKQRLGLSILRFACVTFFYACVGFCLEILGDIDLEVDGNGAIVGISERSPNYDTTLLTQLYFVVVTLSTVGYGDITPGTYWACTKSSHTVLPLTLVTVVHTSRYTRLTLCFTHTSHHVAQGIRHSHDRQRRGVLFLRSRRDCGVEG